MANIRARLAEGLEQDNLLSVVRGIFKGNHCNVFNCILHSSSFAEDTYIMSVICSMSKIGFVLFLY